MQSRCSLLGGDGLEADPVGAGDQQAFAAAGGQQQPGLAGGQAERVGDDVDRPAAAWRSRTWVAALAMTAWPRSEPSRSPTSWVMTASPARRLRADLRQPVQELGAFAVAQQHPRLVDDDQPARRRRRPAGGRVDVAPDRVQGEQHAGGAQLVGQLPGRPHHQLPGWARWWSGRRTGP